MRLCGSAWSWEREKGVFEFTMEDGSWGPGKKLFAALRRFGIKLHGYEDVTEEDIMTMVNEGHEQGVLEADETEMISNIFQLGDTTAEDIMTHRTGITALDGSMKLEAALDFMLDEGINTRYPVYGEDMDDIIGILHLRDAAMLARKAEFREQEIRKVPGLLREAAFIPETKKIDSLFKEMQSEKIHMEIVVDEYGQTAGLVTMEDILEEIVGNIMDEYDEEEHYMTEREDGSWLISGLAPFDEVSEALKLSLGEDEEEYDTLNGFLTSRLDRIPAEGEKPSIDQSGWHFQVLTIGNKKIESVLAKKLLEDRKNRMNEEGVETNDETADDPHGRNAP